MSDLLLTPLLLILAVVFAIGTIPLLVSLFRLLSSKEGYLPYYFYTSIFIMAAEIAVSGRNLFINIETIDENTVEAVAAPMPPYILALSRTNSALITFAACQRIVKQFLNAGTQSIRAIILISTLLFFCLTNIVAPAFLSTHPSLTHEYFYLTLVGVAALLFLFGEEEIAIRSARNAILGLLIASAIAALLSPSLVFVNNYTSGVIPGLTYRYAGLTSHPNSLGIYIVLFFPCLLKNPFSRNWINIFAWALGLASLILCQSKTNWITAIFSLSFLIYYKYGTFLKGRLLNVKKPIFPALIIIAIMIISASILGITLFTEIGGKIYAFFVYGAGANLMSLTGRDLIWNVAINEWQQNPLFGYGLTIWNEAHRAKIGMSYAVSAHSQFFQTLSSAGIVGVIGLVIYMLTLLWFTLKTAKTSQGLSMAIFSILFIRSFSEALEFQTYDITHVLLLMIIGAQYKSQQQLKLTHPPMSPKVFTYQGIS